nr:hypothetical protein [Tanacetum cinerariifolium]
MSFESQSVSDHVIPKFDMHIYTSVLTTDEVNSLVKEHAIPLDLHPCVHPFTLAMNNLPGDKIEKSDYQKVVEHEDERVLAAQRKAHAAKDKAAGKRSAAEDDSTHSGPGTHHSTSPLTTIIPNDTEPTAGGSNLALEFANRQEGDAGNSLDDARNDTEVNSPHFASSPHFEHSLQSQHSAHSDEDTHGHSNGDGLYHDKIDEHARRHASSSTGCVLSSSSGGSGCQRYEALDYWELYQSHFSCQDVFDRLTDTKNQLVDVIRSRSALSDDHKILQQEHLSCVSKKPTLTQKLDVVEKEKDELLDKNREQEEQIKRLEEALASKTSSLSKQRVPLVH